MGRNTLVIGITGKIASGKDTSAKILTENYGFEEINADEIGHDALKHRKNKILSIFGNEILNSQNEIDRSKLRHIVLKNNEKLLELEKISHPYIYEKIKEIIEKSNYSKLLINAALLFKINLEKFCDYIIFIDANENVIKERLSNLRKLNSEEINSIINIQNEIFFDKNISNLKIINIINNIDYDSLKNELDNKIKEVLDIWTKKTMTTKKDLL